LLLNAFKPSKTYFVLTKENADRSLPIILEKTGLKPSQYSIELVEYAEMDASEIYEKIRKHLEFFKGKRVAIDLTRGKRVMSAALGIVGSFFGCDLIYVDEEWDLDTALGIPGTEHLVVVRNPYKIFGDLEQRYGMELFNRFEYASAAEIFRELRFKVVDPRVAEIKALLSEGCMQWDSFNFRAALEKLSSVDDKINQYMLKPPFDRAQLRKNLEVLRVLEGIQSAKMGLPELLKDRKNAAHLVADAYCNGMRRAAQGRFEDAVARFYRLIELASQQRLAEREIDTAALVMNFVGSDLVKTKYPEITKQFYGIEKTVPQQISLMDGHIILFALEDELWKGEPLSKLRALLETMKVRDHSIVAHGAKPVDQSMFDKFKVFGEEFAEKICALANMNFKELCERHRHPKLVSA
jgi:CRISPR-associated protein (TIGR02710 family)